MMCKSTSSGLDFKVTESRWLLNHGVDVQMKTAGKSVDCEVFFGSDIVLRHFRMTNQFL